jgi:hypothetical protein
VHAACDVLGIRRGFDENDLYENLTWLCQHQEQIELRLFAARRGRRKPELFLYDVTSSYLEGEDNALSGRISPRAAEPNNESSRTWYRRQRSANLASSTSISPRWSVRVMVGPSIVPESRATGSAHSKRVRLVGKAGR